MASYPCQVDNPRLTNVNRLPCLILEEIHTGLSGHRQPIRLAIFQHVRRHQVADDTTQR